MPKMKLSDIGHLSRGKSKHRPRNDKILYGGIYPFIQTSDIKNANHILQTYEQTYNEIGLKQSKLWEKNTICITIAANIADSAILGFDACFPDSVIGLTVNDKIANYHYIEYLLQYYKRIIQNQSNGTSQENINLETFEQVYFDIPSLNEQNNISNVLYSIDKKIELNNRINRELEKFSKTLYEYWFVQFNFPDEFGRPYKSSGGLMKKSNILNKYIPEKWNEGKLFDYIEKEKGGDWGKDEPQGNYLLKVKCFRGADIPTMNTCWIPDVPTRYINKNNSFKILNNKDIIIEISGGSPTQSTGRIAYINNELLNKYDADLITSNFCKAISLKSLKYVYNFYLEWQILYNQGVFFNYEGKTTGIKNLLYDDFINSYNTVIPDKNTIEEFYNIVEPIFNQIQRNCKEAIYLMQLRDFLLPMLMNGQVTIQQ